MAKTSSLLLEAMTKMHNGVPPHQPRRLLLFGVGKLDDMLAKGNVWYVRHYEQYFDEVYVVYLLGSSSHSQTLGKTHLVSLGSGFTPLLELALAPLMLLRHARKIRPTHFLTADIVFSWWTSLLIRWLAGARVVLMPVCLPENIYAATKRSISGIPIWLERVFIRLSFGAAKKVISTSNQKSQGDWLFSLPYANGKIQLVDSIVEEYPSPVYYQRQKEMSDTPASKDHVATLLYVGRLHAEKQSGDLIEMMKYLLDDGLDVQLVIAGDGNDRENMQRRARALGLGDQITFLGMVSNEELINLYGRADIFVSTVTGTSLREAGLLGVPTVSYDISWVRAVFRDQEEVLLARMADPQDLSSKVKQLVQNPKLRMQLAKALREKCLATWSLEKLTTGLGQAFGDPNLNQEI